MERGVREGMDWPYNEDDYEKEVQLADNRASMGAARSPFDTLLDELVALRMERDRLEAREKTIIKRVQEIQPLLKLYFDANPQRQSVEINGYNVKMERMLFAHAKTEKADGIAALRRAGLEQFVSETYSLQTLSGYFRELAEQVEPGDMVQLPPELVNDFEVAEVFEVKAKKSQKGRKRSAGNKKDEAEDETWQQSLIELPETES